MTNSAIEAHGLGKLYTLGSQKGYRALRDVIASMPRLLSKRAEAASEKKQLWALKDVSFLIPEGQVVGIIGRNGSGKSTLLKLLSRITDPTTGSARIRGRVGALLEVGTGFHPELTGRENIYVNGAILGMRRREIDAKFDAIVDFSGVEEFLDTPVKRYSSGMRVRLAFSVAAHLEPEILIVDEVLAVGDAVFQRKCLGRMQDVATEGRTVLIVSHQLDMIQSFCSRALWLDGGRLAYDGAADEVVSQYLHSVFDTALSVDLATRADRSGSGLVRVVGMSLSRSGQPASAGITGQSLDMHFDYEGNRAGLPTLQMLAEIKNEAGVRVVGLFTHATGQDFVDAPPRGRLTCHVPRLTLEQGRYTVSVAMRVGRELVDRIDAAAVLEVLPGDFFGSGFDARRIGPVLCDHSWSIAAAGQGG